MLSYIYNTIYTGIVSLISDSPNENKEASELDKINELWLSTYNERKNKTKQSLENQPVLLLNGDELILRYMGTRKVYQYIPKEYHQLKSVAHISCLIHTLLKLKDEKTISIEIASREQQVKSTLEKLQLSNNLEKYQPLIEEYKRILKKKDISRLHNIKGSLEEIIAQAAKYRLDSLHKISESIRKEITEKKWNQVAVIVMGPQMPREGELAMQYYGSILNISNQWQKCPYQMKVIQNLSQQRLIYAESIYEEEKALDLLTTHICDEDLGKDLLGSKEAMHSDVLKEATKKYLGNLHQK